ncbi:hypothetical protein Bca52824_087176 [Brassica carinata]|uniref:Uncharacterized protein n=1 Tax=Brassica carinata TaxID=52824 RepID=A0A8X7PB97_BRACI|nr:hypothetical protein Bca52824_087176 [Brassica carinata]
MIYHPGRSSVSSGPLAELLRGSAGSVMGNVFDSFSSHKAVRDLLRRRRKLQLLSKKPVPTDVQGSTSSDADRASKEGAPGLVNEDVGAEPSASGPKKKKKSKKSRGKATEELPLEEIASLDETTEGLEARKEKGGKKRPYEVATSSADHGEAPAVGREGAAEGPFESNHSEAAPEDRPRKKKKKRSIEAEPHPSRCEAAYRLPGGMLSKPSQGKKGLSAGQ